MHRRVRRPSKHEDAHRYGNRARNRRRQPKLRLARPLDARILLQAPHEIGPDAVPQGIQARHKGHTDEDA